MKEYVIKKVIDMLFDRVGQTLQAAKAKLPSSAEDLESAIDHHMRDVRNWCGEISFADLRGSKATTDVYIPLDVFLHPRRLRVALEGESDLVALDDIVKDESFRHLVILGQPGAGKTTSMKHLCHPLLHDEGFLADQINFPILVRLRDINVRQKEGEEGLKTRDDGYLISMLQEILGIRVEFPADLLRDEEAGTRSAIRRRVVIDILDALKVLIILDGLDEIVFKKHREAVLKELRILGNQLERSRMILTSRTGEFNYHIEHTSQFEISPLSEQQLLAFASQWLGAKDGGSLLAELKRSPFADAAVRPLTIAHLCAIYERVGKIPDKPKTVYRKIVNLALDEWDQQRSVKRVSAYANFENDRKFEFLSNLSYVLTTSIKGHGSVFTRDDLIAAYQKIYDNFDLPKDDAAKVCSELETHTGLFVLAGYERYEFCHKSVQEYLSAEFLVRLPSIPTNPRILANIPNELAIAVAISSRPSEYFRELVTQRLPALKAGFAFVRAFVTRLLLEKPDFEKTPGAGAALLRLYSQYLQAVSGHPQQIPLFLFDELKAEFEALAGLIRQRVQPQSLLAGYKARGVAPALDGEEILRLGPPRQGEGSRAKKSTKARFRVGLPDEVWVRPSLVRVVADEVVDDAGGEKVDDAGGEKVDDAGGEKVDDARGEKVDEYS